MRLGWAMPRSPEPPTPDTGRRISAKDSRAALHAGGPAPTLADVTTAVHREVNAALTRAGTLAEVLGEVAAVLARHLDAEAVHIWTGASADRLELAAGIGNAEAAG